MSKSTVEYHVNNLIKAGLLVDDTLGLGRGLAPVRTVRPAPGIAVMRVNTENGVRVLPARFIEPDALRAARRE